MLSNLEDQRKPMVQLQSQIRQLSCHLRQTERDIYDLEFTAANEVMLDTGLDHATKYQAESELKAHLFERYDRLVLEFQDLKESLQFAISDCYFIF